ncbi:MAG: hypothetical protein L0229_03265 [Blastocatellia bacterium]|nr:hypothetical protein [Blastocatellia bacterium]
MKEFEPLMYGRPSVVAPRSLIRLARSFDSLAHSTRLLIRLARLFDSLAYSK